MVYLVATEIVSLLLATNAEGDWVFLFAQISLKVRPFSIVKFCSQTNQFTTRKPKNIEERIIELKRDSFLRCLVRYFNYRGTTINLNRKIQMMESNTNPCIQFRITLESMRSQCHGQRKSFTMQLNSRWVRRIELYTNVCTESEYKSSITKANLNPYFFEIMNEEIYLNGILCLIQ